MKFLGVDKVQQGRFVTRYDLRYETADRREKVYEMISRQSGIEDQRQLWDHPTDAVIMMLTDETGERVLLLHEFRMAAGEAVYNFPAGLIEAGESVEEAARRELREETGLRLTSVKEILPAGYNAVGFSNEKNACLLGTAAGEIKPSSSDEEEIVCGWYGREQVKELLATAAFESRTQLFCHLWAHGRLTQEEK